MHILHVDFFTPLLLGVPVDEEVFFVSPPINDYFFDVAIPFSDILNNGRCIRDGCRWKKMHIDGAEGIGGVDWGWGRAVVDSDAIAVGQQWVGGHGVETSINENMINVGA